MSADWLSRLKAAYDAGYYKTEADVDWQSGFPWQNKRCKDCPFWSPELCQVRLQCREPNAHTCSYFDPWNRRMAARIVGDNRPFSFRGWGWPNQ
jgi:hypothetical protein